MSNVKIQVAAFAVSMLAAASAGTASAAEIYKGSTTKSNVVYISGQIVAGDYEKFARVSRAMGHVDAVLLDSPGGILSDGLSIAEATRQMGVWTGVPNNATCASMCAIIWLAGRNRLVASNAHVGFHAIYYAKDGAVAGGGNAMIGAFLSKLGLSYTAIAFATSADPSNMSWLSVTKARELGIAVRVVPITEK